MGINIGNEIDELNNEIRTENILSACEIFNKIYYDKLMVNNWSSCNIEGFLSLLSDQRSKSDYSKKYIELYPDLESSKKVVLALQIPYGFYTPETENLNYLKTVFYEEIQKKLLILMNLIFLLLLIPLNGIIMGV